MAAAALMSHGAQAQTAPGAGTLAISPYLTAAPLSTLTNALTAANSGLTITSSTYTGADNQAGTYTGFDISPSTAGKATITAPDGVLLTTGSAAIPLTNTSTSFGTQTGSGGNEALSALSVSAGGTSSTFDQDVISINFTVNNPALNAVKANFVYASEEYPDQSVTDIFGFFVDGKNYAAFPDGSLVSFKGTTSGFFNDNTDGSYPIEYDGISNQLTVNGLLDPTLAVHTLTIAIADTSDAIFDSGAFIGNLQSALVTGGGGITTTPVGTSTTINTTGGDIAANIFSLGSAAAQAATVEFDGGILRMTGGSFLNNIIAAPVTIEATNGTVDTSTGNGGFSGVVAGPGSLTVTGGGIFALTGTNTYAGGTILDASTVAVGNATALGTGAVAFNNGTLQAGVDGLTLGNAATLAGNGAIDTQAFGLAYAGTISGTGQLTKTGTGTLALTAANSYSGGTLVAGGTVLATTGSAPDGSSSIGSGTLGLAGGTFQIQQGASLTFTNPVQVGAGGGAIDGNQGGVTLSGPISGGPSTGPLQFVNSGGTARTGNFNESNSIVLSGANTYSGGSIVRETAAVLVNAKNGLGSGSLQIDAGGVVDLNGTSQAVTSLTGSGLIFAAGGPAAIGGLGLSTLTVQNGTFGGNIEYGHFTDASGATAQGDITLVKASDGSATGGTLTLSGPSSYGEFGGQTLLQAGTLAVGDSTALGSSALLFSDGTTLQAAASVTIANAVVLSGQDTVDTQSFASGFGLGGVVSGTGTLVKTGSSGLGLYAANTYTGGTLVEDGRVTLRNDAALGTGPVTFAGGNLRAGVDGLTIGNAATLASNATVDTQSFTLTYTGPIGGAGALGKLGDGTLVLPGANTYAGGTTLNAGTVTIGANASLGTGALTFAGGTLRAGVDGLSLGYAGTIASSGSIDTQGFGLVSSGSIAGPGVLTKLGTGTLTVTGDYGYTGGTTIAGGVLQIGAGGTSGSLAGNVANSGVLAFDRSDDIAFAGTIAGTGAVTKSGAGALTLSGASSYSGGTSLLAGTLEIGSGAALGSGALSMNEGTTLRFVADGLSLGNAIVFTGLSDPAIDTGSGNQTISGPISGPGALTKLGSGSLDLTGIDTYSGATTVAAGTLLVDGSVNNSVVTVNGGAALGGAGSIGSLVAQSGSTVRPAAGKTLTVVGNATFASGSTYAATVNADGTASRLTVGGRATLNNAGLSILAGSGKFDVSRSYTLLSAPGGVSGTFGTVQTATALALLTPTVSYSPDSVVLNLRQNDFATVAGTSNQAAVAKAIQALGPGNPLFDAVVQQDQAGARQAFDATSGVTHATTTSTVRTTTIVLTGMVMDRLWDTAGSGLSARQVLDQFETNRMPALVRCYGPVPDPVPVTPAPASYTAWGEGFGSFGHTDANANAGALDRTLGGFVLGIDTPLSGFASGWRAGIAGGYTNTSFESPLDGGSGTVEGVFGSLYGGARYGSVDIKLGTTISGNSTDSLRRVAFPGFLETERSSYGGMSVQGFGEVGYRIPIAKAVLEPVVGAAIYHVHQDGFSERGGAAALVGAAQDTDLGTTTLGFRGEVAPVSGIPMVAHAFLGWQHTIGTITPTSTLAFESAASNTFTAAGSPIDRDALAASAALDYRTSAAMDVGLSYTGFVGPTTTEHAVKGRVEYRF